MTSRRALRKIIVSLVLCSISALLLGCGSGGIGSVASFASGGTSGTGVSMGQVSSFGSVLVNGIRYEITPATVFEGPFSGFAETDLAPGMLVQVNWSSENENDAPVAQKITYRPELIGSLTSGYVPATADGPARIEVAGQTVTIMPTTLIDDPYGRGSAQVPLIVSAADLQDGERVEVSGTLVMTDPGSGASHIEAVRIARLAPPADDLVSISGVVSNTRPGTLEIVDSNNPTPLIVTFAAGAVSDSDLCQTNACEMLQNGHGIRVSGHLTGPATISATRIERPLEQLQPLEDPGDTTIEADLDGQITDVRRGEQRFRVAGQWVEYDGSTAFPLESASALEPGRHVHLSGTLSDDGNAETVLLAEVVEIRPPAEIRLEDRITEAGPTAADGSRLLATRIGLQIRVAPATILRDEEDDGRLQPEELMPDDAITVSGFFNNEGQLIAVILEQDDDDDEGGCALVARVFNSKLNAGADARYYSFSNRPGLVIALSGADLADPQIDSGQLGEFESNVCALRPAGVDFLDNPIDAGFHADEVDIVFNGHNSDDDDD